MPVKRCHVLVSDDDSRDIGIGRPCGEVATWVVVLTKTENYPGYVEIEDTAMCDLHFNEHCEDIDFPPRALKNAGWASRIAPTDPK